MDTRGNSPGAISGEEGKADDFDRLILLLDREGLPEESRELDTLLHRTAWTTGSELLGELGLALRRIRAARWKRMGAESRAAWKRCAARTGTAWRLFPFW